MKFQQSPMLFLCKMIGICHRDTNISSRPFTGNQKAKERHSWQLDIMSNVENVDTMLGSYSRGEERNDQSESELNLDSGSISPQQSSNLAVEDFRS